MARLTVAVEMFHFDLQNKNKAKSLELCRREMLCRAKPYWLANNK